MKLDQALTIYNHALQEFPELYASYPFESWLEWLTGTAKFVNKDGEALFITDEGREFLKYLVTRGYSFARFG